MTEKKGILDRKKLPELRSEEVQEVLGWVPPWILRAGITVLFVIVIQCRLLKRQGKDNGFLSHHQIELSQ